jgi:hypothetical protein
LPPSTRHHRDVIAIGAIGTSRHCSAASQTNADRDPALARIMGMIWPAVSALG